MQTLLANKHSKLFINNKINIPEKMKGTENCKEREVIYAAQCSKLYVLYVGRTGEQLSECFPKHHYNVKSKPDNSELAKHFHENHDINENLNVTTLKTKLKLQLCEDITKRKGFVD